MYNVCTLSEGERVSERERGGWGRERERERGGGREGGRERENKERCNFSEMLILLPPVMVLRLDATTQPQSLYHC